MGINIMLEAGYSELVTSWWQGELACSGDAKVNLSDSDVVLFISR